MALVLQALWLLSIGLDVAGETAGRSDFANLVASLLEEDQEGLLRFDEHRLDPLNCAELALPADARRSIRRIAEQPAA
jgi:hypothetical protein